MDIKYASADKAKTSFGYIGITFLVAIFGSIFLNDLIKVCIYYCDGLRVWWRRRRNRRVDIIQNQRQREEQEREQIRIEMERINTDELEEKLQQVYFKLAEVNARNGTT